MILKDKAVVITGASRGLGKELALMFSKEGSKCVVGARTKADLDEFTKVSNVTTSVTDVRDEGQVQRLAETAVKRFGRIDIWVNNAGVRIPHASIEKTDWKRVHDMMEINFFGVVYGSKVALVRMKKQKA
ncbi:MAG: oxidoreductase, short-chain dehydrogenase/reductase, partial [archaeon GW2011_AR6]